MSTYAYSFGTSTRKGLLNKTGFPGPGTYGDSYKSAKKKDPQWRFGSEKRKSMARTQNYPPPDTYNANYRASV